MYADLGAVVGAEDDIAIMADVDAICVAYILPCFVIAIPAVILPPPGGAAFGADRGWVAFCVVGDRVGAATVGI
jgi:hypothetical protein